MLIPLIRQLISKMRKMAAYIKNVSPFLPAYIHFQWHGHKQAWRIFTHMTKRERLMLYRLALKQLPGSVLLEIGSYLGSSSCFLAAAASEIRGGTKVHCVDTWKNEGMTEGQRDTWSEFQTNTLRYLTIIVPHRGHSVKIAGNFNEKIDLLFIDGDHSYDGCRIDVENWLPHLKPGGLVIMHDYEWALGVQKVVHEFIAPRAITVGTLPNLYWAWIK